MLGDDILAQLDSTNGLCSLLADGHGSTRQLYDSGGSQWGDSEWYDYDAYGEMFHYELDDPGSLVSRLSTDLLHAGEQWDADLGMQYLRARYYLPGQGVFNRVDPFFGNQDDPQSLHKYAYVHGDPVNGVDPSGMTSLITLMKGIATQAILVGLAVPTLRGITTARSGGSYTGGFLRGIAMGGAMAILVVKNKGVFNDNFGGDFVQIMMAGMVAAVYEFFTNTDSDVTEAVNSAFWEAADSVAIALAYGKWFSDQSSTGNPVVAAILAATSSIIQGVAGELWEQLTSAMDGSGDWGVFWESIGGLVWDAFVAGVRAYLVNRLIDHPSFDSPAARQAVASLIVEPGRTLVEGIYQFVRQWN